MTPANSSMGVLTVVILECYNIFSFTYLQGDNYVACQINFVQVSAANYL
jgi:hypothetical protein